MGIEYSCSSRCHRSYDKYALTAPIYMVQRDTLLSMMRINGGCSRRSKRAGTSCDDDSDYDDGHDDDDDDDDDDANNGCKLS